MTAISTLEVEWEISEFKVALGLGASLGYIGPCLKIEKQNTRLEDGSVNAVFGSQREGVNWRLTTRVQMPYVVSSAMEAETDRPL